jgi:RNA polymerase sigma-70 factor (ECF subfamily)
MLRLARNYVAGAAVAEEVVQDTWFAVLRGLGGFAERSTFRVWLLKILVNRAMSTGVREHRSIAVGGAEAAVEASRFDGTGAWMSAPEHWVEGSDDRLSAAAHAETLRATLDRLPTRQREVIVLRDVVGLSGAEVCAVLGISAPNQRVLLHRSRSRLREALETANRGVAECSV